MRLHFIPVLFALITSVVSSTPFGGLSGGRPSMGIVVCGGSASGQVSAGESGKFIIPLPGWGNHSYEISAANDSARFYFNQGLNMYYGYHMKEALASFKEASRFDPASAMAHWGQALAMGPYYNSAHSYVVPDGIAEVLLAMNQNVNNTSAKEKHLIRAMCLRYPEKVSGGNLKARDEVYASEMKKIIEQFPDDPEIKMLYIDAVMLMHAWDFWNTDGTKKSWTAEIVDMCGEVLKRYPDHPAELHYYIHLTEASRHPEVAIANAGALERLFPGIAHMVHMSSHAYQRNGQYAKAVKVNDKADDNLELYASMAGNLSLSKHSPHYFAVQTYSALTGAMYTAGMKSAARCRRSVSPTPENTYDQYLYMIPVLTQVRMGKWEAIMADDVVPDSSWHYARLLHHFARGIAFSSTGHPDSASWHLSQLRKYQKSASLLKRRIPFNAPVQMAGIAERILNGLVLFNDNKRSAAVVSLEEAIAIEDKLIYTEPADWPIPARQFLGAFLLKMRQYALAEKVYVEDLALNPNNGWSLLGMYHSLRAQRKAKEMARYKARYLQSFADADEIPTSSVFLK